MATEGNPRNPRVPPSKPGKTKCLKCQKTFASPDRVRVRICPKCKRDPERIGLAGEKSCDVHGVDVPDAEEEF